MMDLFRIPSEPLISLPEAKLLAFIYNLVCSLAILHAHGIVHNELKFANILVFDGTTQVIRFRSVSFYKTRISVDVINHQNTCVCQK